MANARENAGRPDAMGILSRNLRCMDPPGRDLAPEQQWALHEFLHEVLAAGYKLYQKVAPDVADAVLQSKFHVAFPKDPDLKA